MDIPQRRLQASPVGKIVGIDLGTTNSSIAIVEAGMPGLLADSDGKRLMPSVVHYPSEGKPVTGHAAQRILVIEPKRTVYAIKRFVGGRLQDLSESDCSLEYQIGGNPIVVKIGDQQYTPEEISAEILSSLKAQATEVLGYPVDRAVITVPAYFNDAQRQATKAAGELAGFSVERIINEPTAAALACGLEKLPEKSRVAVYDLGGGTFDLSILELRDGIFQVLSTHGNTRLGGGDIDNRIYDWLLNEVTAEGFAASDEFSRARIREAAEKAKIDLSRQDIVDIKLPFLSADSSFECQFTRKQLEDFAKPTIDQTLVHCRLALADAGLMSQDLCQVVLVGGQTRMPLVRRLVADWFGCAEYVETTGDVRIGDSFHEANSPTLNTSNNPDEAVALGAAIQGAVLSGDLTNYLVLDVTPLSLGLETFGGLMNVIIPRNTTIPTKAGEMFTNAVDGQREMLVHVLQGEREKSEDNWSLGRFELNFQPAKRGSARVGVQFEINADGILNVLARDTSTGHERILKIKSAVDVDDVQVQEMVEKSVELAFEDMDARRWVESSMRAVEAVKATRVGLEEFAGELGNAEVVTAAIIGVEQVLEKGDSGPDSLQHLKEAVARLDTVSLPLADLMMDRATEGMLRRRNMLD